MSKYTLSIGIVGLPNVGKSTLFNALLRRQVAFAANYPFATIEPTVGIVELPDPRLDVLAELVRKEFGRGGREVPEKITRSTVKFVDIAGLVAGAHKGEGLGNKFLSHIREVDAIIHLIRAFDDENVARAGSKDPKSDIEVVQTELILADLQTLEKQRTELKGAAATKEENARVNAVLKLREPLSKGIPATDVTNLLDEERVAAASFNLLSAKPVIYVFNVSEKAVATYKNPVFPNGLAISAKIESELSVLDEKDQMAFLKEWGLEESGLDKVIRAGFSTLGLQTFLTAGPKEVRSWTIRKGWKAPQAAGVIHSDFERGFISAEVVSFEDLVAAGSFAQAKALGKMRLEGKTYDMQDGDVVEFRFSV